VSLAADGALAFGREAVARAGYRLPASGSASEALASTMAEL
jgi:hypothetical protein